MSPEQLDQRSDRHDYDYLIIDSQGTRRVKDGVESPATEDDLAPRKPHRCVKCTAVESRGFIYSGHHEKIERCWRGQNIQLIQRVVGIIAIAVTALISIELLVRSNVREGLVGLLGVFVVYLLLGKANNPEDTIRELGYFTLPDWTGHLMWYGFICSQCGETNCDYCHGHDPYLKCQSCGANLHLRSKRFYANDGRAYPAAWRQALEMIRVMWRCRNMTPYQDPLPVPAPLHIEDLEKLKARPDSHVPRDLES